MNSYTTIQKIQDYTGETIDAEIQDTVEEWIEAISKYIEDYTKREFIKTTEARYFDGNNKREMRIDDALAITTLELAGTFYGDSFTEEEDYITIPANELPITTIHLKDNWFYKGIQNVKITADWGYSETTPEDIQFAATILVGKMINAQIENSGKESEKIGDYSVSYGDNKQDQDVQRAMGILDAYTRYYL